MCSVLIFVYGNHIDDATFRVARGVLLKRSFRLFELIICRSDLLTTYRRGAPRCLERIWNLGFLGHQVIREVIRRAIRPVSSMNGGALKKKPRAWILLGCADLGQIDVSKKLAGCESHASICLLSLQPTRLLQRLLVLKRLNMSCGMLRLQESLLLILLRFDANGARVAVAHRVVQLRAKLADPVMLHEDRLGHSVGLRALEQVLFRHHRLQHLLVVCLHQCNQLTVE